jgi:hypothetical protein
MSKLKFKNQDYYMLKKSFGKMIWKRVPYHPFFKGVNNMTSRVYFAGVAALGLFANLFVAFAGKSLEPSMASLFTNIGSVAIASAVVYLILNQKCQVQIDAERSEIYRDFDAVYRYIDDNARDLRDEVKECSRNSTCSKK